MLSTGLIYHSSNGENIKPTRDYSTILEHDFSTLCEELQRNHNRGQSTLSWLEIDMHKRDIPNQSTKGVTNGTIKIDTERDEDVSAKKRRRMDNDQSDSFRQLNPSNIEDVDTYLQAFYESLPQDTLILIFAQESLVTLKKLIAKKLR